jgi:hypothetical protein
LCWFQFTCNWTFFGITSKLNIKADPERIISLQWRFVDQENLQRKKQSD